jgi:hypothetical protein
MIWIGLLIMVAVIAVSVGSLRSNKGDGLGIPLVALGTFTFLYVIQPLQLIWTGTMGLFLTDWQATKALLIPALMLASFMWGWLRPGRPRAHQSPSWDPRAMWIIGFVAACAGLILFVIFLERSGGIAQSYSQAHGHAMAWTENTAYLYDSPWLMLSGAVMMILAGSESPHYKWKAAVPYVFMALYLANAMMGGDRGPLFAVGSAAFVGNCIARRRQVKLKQAAGFLLVLGCVVVVAFANRDSVHLGEQAPIATENPEEALNGLVGTSEYDQEHGSAAQEFLYHAATIEAVDQTGKLDWGQAWIEFFFINPIPRLLWPEKPTPDWSGITSGDIYEHTSIMIAGGAAEGIVGDLYERFHLFSIFFFYGLGFGLRRLFVLGRNFSSPWTTVGYVMIYALSLNMFAQGVGSIFVSLPYSMVPVVFCTWVMRKNRKKAPRQQGDMIFRQVAAVRGEQWSS